MKTYKDRQHSLMLKPFGLQGKQYLGLTVFLFFDLNAPENLLKEQELWREVPQRLGKGKALDMGMPKSKAEFLVFGSCHTPRGSQTRGTKVNVRVGKLEKTLYVFGRRYWNRMGGISRPEEFTEIPLTYANAYGGPEYALNPLGMGYKTSQDVGENKIRTPLPHVEHPARLIGSLGYHPQPASFEPLDMTWPQRYAKTGTYDDKWLKERWPDMPDDMDPTFHNTAAPDQWQEQWFAGNEEVELLHMHPDIPCITTRLPGKRIRAFLTMFKDFNRFKKAENMETEFREVAMHIDTLLLFPDILRGVVAYRGAVESSDDEYYDVLRAFVQTEELTEEPKSLEYYHQEQLKRLDRSVPIDMSPFEEAGKKVSRLLLKMKNLPKEIDRMGKSTLGKTPVMPHSPQDLTDMMHNNMAAGMETINKLEKVSKDLHAGFGHKVEIDLKQFDAMRRDLTRMQTELSETGKSGAAALQELQAMQHEMTNELNDVLKQNITPKKLEELRITADQAREAGFPVDGIQFTEGTGDPFHDQGFPLVVAARKRLEADPEALAKLTRLGLEKKTITRAWLGLLPEPRRECFADWGLTPDPPEDEHFTLPGGLLMPRFADARLNRIMVRPDILKEREKPDELDAMKDPADEQLSPGSAQTPLALPPAAEEAHWVRVADELQALYVEQEAGDACGVVNLATPTDAPDDDTAKEIKNAGVFLCIFPHGTTEQSAAWKLWAKTFPNARLLALPKGETVFHARRAGHDVRKLIMDALPEEFAKNHSIECEVPKEAGKGKIGIPKIAFPKIDIAAKIDALHKEFEASFDPVRAEIAAIEKDLADTVPELSGASGAASAAKEATKDAAGESGPPSELCNDFRKLVAQNKTLFAKPEMLPPEKIALFDEADAHLAEAGQTMDALQAQGQSLSAELEQRMRELDKMAASNTIPGMSLEEMQAAGLDPDKLAPLTRERVIDLLQRGQSLAEYDFTGADLSGLDMSGADLRKALLIDVNFTRATLDNAGLDMALVSNCDLTGASLKGGRIKMTTFLRSKLVHAQLQNSQWSNVTVKDSDFTDADFSDADLRLAVMQKSRFENAVFSNASFYLAIIGKSDLSGALLRNTKMRKGIINGCCLDRADFSNASVHRTMVKNSHGKEVDFTQADLSHIRTGGGTDFSGANFLGACLEGASLRETNLSGANFKNASLNHALVELCDLTRAKLRLVVAKHARLIKTDFEGADMAGINLLNGSLRKSRLVHADLTAANLFSVDLFKSVMHNTKLDRANLKRTLIHRREEYVP